jgi:pimeloyl-ACP methyl ester carboxylesterase
MAETESEKKTLEGIWQGEIDAGMGKLGVAFQVGVDDRGRLKAVLAVPDQGLTGIKVDQVAIEWPNVRLVVSGVKGGFSGRIDHTHDSIEGTWEQAGRRFPLTLRRTREIHATHRPQEPTRPFPYDELEVRFENPRAGIILAGTLTIPRGGRGYPAVVLIPGSGPHDRDETIFGHKPFLIIADHLTRSGTAVLRFDGRGVGESTGDRRESTSQDFATDVESAVVFLRSREEIDDRWIGLLGHSEGGIIAPIVASRDPLIAFMILLAGSGMNGESILLSQGERVLRASGVDERLVQINRRVQERLFKAVHEGKDADAMQAVMRDMLREEVPQEDREMLEKQGFSDGYFMEQAKAMVLPWMRHFLSYDPIPALEKVRCPVLALFGERDTQVPPDENTEPVRKALGKGDKRSSVVVLPRLNHLFQEAETGSPNEYSLIEQTMSPTALRTIDEWIKKIYDKGRAQ